MIKPTNNPKSAGGSPEDHIKRGVGPAQDYSFQPDERIYAAISGYVTYDWAGACGNRARLTNGDVEFYMCHLMARRANKQVKEGDVIGVMGNTGESYGRHLHLVIYDKGQRVADPDKWLNKRVKKEEQMFNGKTAKQWFSVALRYDKRIKNMQKSINQLKANNKASKAEYEKTIADLEKELSKAGSFTDDDRQTINAIKTGVDFIKNLLSKIFK